MAISSYDVKMLTIGPPDVIEETELCFPVPNKILFDYKKIKPYVASQPKSVFFIIVLLHLFGQTIDSILVEIGNRDNIIGIFVCVNQIYNLANNQTNVFHLAKRLLTCKTTSCAIHSYERASERLYQTSYQGLAYIFKQKSNNLRQWLTTTDKIRVCDILLIPCNTSDPNLFDFQQRLIELCQNLCHDYEPRVCTIYDYIESDQSDPNMSKEDRAFVNQQNEILCSLAKKIAPIRIYVVGNEENISNKWSQLMIENEPDNGGKIVPLYDQWCTFVENEPVTAESLHHFVHHHGSSWKVTNTIPIRLDTIREDPYFLVALDRSRTTLEAREMFANMELSLWVMNYHEDSTTYSNEFQDIKQPDSPVLEPNDNNTVEMNDAIRYRRSVSSNSDNDS